MKDDNGAHAVERWVLKEGGALELGALVSGLGYRLTRIGLPIDRLGVSFGLLNPSLLAGGIVWRPAWPLEFKRYAYAERHEGMYERSPLKVAHDTGRWVTIDVANTSDAAYGIVRELKDEGLSHYIAIPLPGSADDVMSLTVATRSEAGFSDEHHAALREITPALSAIVEIKRLRSIFQDVLGAYVGRSPAREIAAGSVHRGQITEMRAAILIADLRGFTQLSTKLHPTATADVINRYYDIVVPPVEAHGGEVLKFVGDAILGVFRTVNIGETAAALAALEAGREALATNPATVEAAGETVPLRFGIAIHLGDAVYGNVGSGDRLDFTVIGRDVNIAARISALCSVLGEDFLVSEQVASMGRSEGIAMSDAGAHAVHGLDTLLPVFVPYEGPGTRGEDDGVSKGPPVPFLSLKPGRDPSRAPGDRIRRQCGSRYGASRRRAAPETTRARSARAET